MRTWTELAAALVVFAVLWVGLAPLADGAVPTRPEPALAADAPPVPAAPAPPPPPVVPSVTAPSVNLWLVAGLVGTVLWTNVVMVFLKSMFPGWGAKAWAPPLIGLVTAFLGALATGGVHDVPSLIGWMGTGLAAGGVASSLRDTVAGK